MEKERMTVSEDITRDYLDRWLFEVRHVDSAAADPSTELFGRRFAAPIATAALSHLNHFANLPDGTDGMALMAKGAALADLPCFTGMGSEDELARMLDTGAAVIKIIKTYRDRDMMYRRIRHAEAHGALAVGIDIDHAFNRDTVYDAVDGLEMRPITAAEIAELAASTRLPFVVKGVLSASDAVKCVNAGVGGLVISHHNGRLDCSVPPLMMLPDIRKAVGKDLPLFVDCSIRGGEDIYRCLAFGANACCIGRPIMGPLREKGAEGVRDTLLAATRDLCYTMSMTGVKDIRHISPDVLHFRNW